MLSPLLSDQFLAGLFNRPVWDNRLNLPHWVCLSVPAWKDAHYITEHFRASLAGCAAGGLPVYVEYGDKTRHVCQVTSIGNVMNIQIDGLEVNRALLNVMGEMLTHDDRSMGLVRIADERQITVSSTAQYLIGKTREEATKQHRSDYWHPEDLHRFNREWRQAMSIGGDWFESSYRCFDPKASAEVRGPNFCNNIFTTRYKLIEGPRKAMFHLCENLDVVAI